jgi:hypothetical protein
MTAVPDPTATGPADEATRPSPTSRPAGTDILDQDLRKAVNNTGRLRRGFYGTVLLVALTGQVSGAVDTLHIPPLFAVPAVAALELGGVVVLANADVRRRLGERATGSQLLSAAVAAGAVAFNWLTHADPLAGGFFAGMSLLGYLVWLTHAENSRRDRLRARGTMPPATPAYEIVGHWLRHPRLTRRAKALAKADPALGLYQSFAAARRQRHLERRRKAISTILHRKIRAAVDPDTADIAIHVYDLDRIADQLADQADYDTLTALIATDLTPMRLTAPPTPPTRTWGSRRPAARRYRPGALAGGSVEADTGHTTATASTTARNDPSPPTATTGPSGLPATRRTLNVGETGSVPGAGQPRSTSTAPPPRAAAPPPAPSADHGATGRAGVASERAAGTVLSAAGTATVGVDDPAPSRQASSGGGTGGVVVSVRPVVPSEPGSHSGSHSGSDSGSDSAAPEDDPIPRQTPAAVAYWRRREPHLHPREIAARIGRSERTVRRHWPSLFDPVR